MRNIVTAIQKRDGHALQQMYTTEKPRQPSAGASGQVFNELFRQLRAAFPAMMSSIKISQI